MKKRRGRGGLPHVGIERRTIHSEEWKRLSGPAKIFYWHLKARFNGSNNGEIELPYHCMKGIKGCSDMHTIAAAIRELESEGWIERRKIGGMYRYKNKFKLTFKYDLYGAG